MARQFIYHMSGLSKAFSGGKKVLDNIHLSFYPDAKIGVLGPNGAGKSTTLRILYTVLKPDSGSATIDGVDVLVDDLEARRRIGTLPHSSGLYPHMTARENIAYYAKLYGVPSGELDARVAQMIE